MAIKKEVLYWDMFFTTTSAVESWSSMDLGHPPHLLKELETRISRIILTQKMKNRGNSGGEKKQVHVGSYHFPGFILSALLFLLGLEWCVKYDLSTKNPSISPGFSQGHLESLEWVGCLDQELCQRLNDPRTRPNTKHPREPMLLGSNFLSC